MSLCTLTVRFCLNAQAQSSQSSPSIIVMPTTGSSHWHEPLAGFSDNHLPTHQLHLAGTATNRCQSAWPPNVQQITEQIREYIFDSLDLLVLFVDIFSLEILNWIVQRGIDHVKTELGTDIPTSESMLWILGFLSSFLLHMHIYTVSNYS